MDLSPNAPLATRTEMSVRAARRGVAIPPERIMLRHDRNGAIVVDLLDDHGVCVAKADWAPGAEAALRDALGGTLLLMPDPLIPPGLAGHAGLPEETKS